jgi:hypothetical protein
MNSSDTRVRFGGLVDSLFTDTHTDCIYTAVRMWFQDRDLAKATYGPIASWDTSEITEMSFLFLHRFDFNGDISRWNVSNVVNMVSMFKSANSFNGDLSRWEVGQVQRMVAMFHSATSFSCDLSSWNVGQKADMQYMFEGATSFTHELGGAWATSKGLKICMVYNCPGSVLGED